MESTGDRFLDIGGGLNWHPAWDEEGIRTVMDNLRAVQLARQHPANRYIVVDARVPKTEAKRLQNNFPNLDFVEGYLGPDKRLPLASNSIDRVEMNFMLTALTATWEKDAGYSLEQDVDIPGYMHTLKEACRVLNPGGRLALTEKRERLNRIRRRLSSSADLDMDGYLMRALGLDSTWGSWNIVEVIDSNETDFTASAITQLKKAEELEDKKKTADLKVFRLEMVKKQISV